MRVVFMGSPAFAIPSLNAIAEEYDLVAAVTQPDRPAGRGRRPRASAVKERCQTLGIPVLQPPRLRDPEAIQSIHEFSPDLIVVAAYGQILPEAILSLPPHGCINVHASLLPRWRGASPIQAAILAGDAQTGVTIMLMDPGMDTGPILAQASMAIGPAETGGELEGRLAHLGAKLLLEVLPEYLEGRCRPIPQDDTKATYAPVLHKSDGALDFNKPADQLARQVRAFEPWPGSYLEWAGKRLIVRKARILAHSSAAPGEVFLEQGRPVIGANPGGLQIEIVQPAGKRPMPAEDFVRGAKGFVGSRIDAPKA